MACVAVVDKFLSTKIKKNSLTIIEKYHFDDVQQASYFLRNLKKLDPRIISYEINHETN